MKCIILSDDYVQGRLSEWGEWFSRDNYENIGFSNKNMLARMRDEGGQIIRAAGRKPLMTNTKAEEIEAILMALYDNHPGLTQVLMITYLYPEAPLYIAKKEFGYKKSNYYKQLHIALAWVKGYLIAKMQIEKLKKDSKKYKLN